MSVIVSFLQFNARKAHRLNSLRNTNLIKIAFNLNEMKEVYILIYLILIQTSVSRENWNENNQVLQQISLATDPYQFIIFKTQNFTSDLILFPEHPSNVFQFPNFSSQLLSLKNSMHVSPIILFTDSLHDAKLLIDLLVEIITLQARPPTLIILFENHILNDIKKTLLYAWKNKILDFTILNVHSKTLPGNIFSYNPFNYKMSRHKFFKGLQVFPEKFQHVKNYPFKIGNKVNESLDGQAIEKLKNNVFRNLVLRLMNFKVVQLPLESELGIDFITYDQQYLWFVKTDANILGILVTPRDSLKNVQLISAELDCRPMVAILPISYRRVVNIPVKIAIYVFIVPGLITGLIKLMNVFGVKTEFDKPFVIMKIFLGQLSNLLMKETTNKIIFLTIIVVVWFAAEDMYTDILEIKIGQQEEKFTKFEDLVNSKLPIYSYYAKNYIFESYTRALVELKANLVQNSYKNDCIDVLKISRDRICVYFYKQAEVYVEKYRNTDGSPFLQIARPFFHCDNLYFQFEFASPYMKRFSEFKRIVQEHGLIHVEFLLNNYTDHVEVEKIDIKKKMKNKSAFQPVLFVLIIGYFFSTLAFIMERVTKRLKKICKYLFIR